MTSDNIYLFIYILCIMYFTALGCFMLAYRSDEMCTRGEIIAKRRMTQSVGAFMILWAFEYVIYLVPMIASCENDHPWYKICFLASMMLNTPMCYILTCAMLQRWKNAMQNATLLGMPFLAILLWFLLEGENRMLLVRISATLHILSIVYIILRYVGDYGAYIRRIRSEYSDISGRDIFWSWWFFLGVGIQAIVFVFYQFYWSFTLEIIYGALSIVNAAYFCYCTHRQQTLDNDIVEETVETVTVNTLEEMPVEVSAKDDSEEKAFFLIVEERLRSLCEEKYLFLEPDLSRESLCHRLSIGRTYLSMYLHSRGLTFYQYINTLRIEYAYNLMTENPDMSIHKISELSGFRSQTTFRKVFKEIMGCLPSELKHTK